MSRVAVAISLSEAARRALEGLAGRRKTARGLARRARIVLAAAEGLENKAIVGSDPTTVGKWRRRFAEHRLDGLCDAPRSGAPRQIGDEEIIARTLEEAPPGAAHWSLRRRRSTGYGKPSASRRIARRPSGCRRIRCSSTRYATSQASLSTRPSAHWCSASTKRARSRRATAPSRCCPCGQARSRGGPTTPCATAPPPCSRRWTSPPQP